MRKVKCVMRKVIEFAPTKIESHAKLYFPAIGPLGLGKTQSTRDYDVAHYQARPNKVNLNSAQSFATQNRFSHYLFAHPHTDSVRSGIHCALGVRSTS